MFFKEQPRAHWVEQLEANYVPHTPVYNLKEVFDDPQVQHMGDADRLIQRKDKPTIKTVKFPIDPQRYAVAVSVAAAGAWRE